MLVSNLLNQLKQRSHIIRGKNIALDEDVAALYGISVRSLKGIVRRHADRFSLDLVFQGPKGKYLFTEEGVLLVSSVLKNPRAARISIEIIRELFGFKNN